MPNIPIEDLTAMVRHIFAQNHTSPDNAAILAETCVAAERDGSESHGLFRLPGYISSLRCGWVDGTAKPTLELDGSVIRVDARNGFAQPALKAVFGSAVTTAREFGVSLVTIRDSHHFSALWLDVEPFARAGLVAMAFVNSIARVVPWGGRKPVYGTNPMALAIPRASGEPVVFDQAASAMAFGDVRLAARAGRELPPGVGVDRNGAPTTNAAEIMDGGALLPFGGYKGSSIAMMVEVLCAGLSGGSFSFEQDFSAYSGAQTPRTGETLIVIDPDRTSKFSFTARMETLFAELQDAGQSRLPGDRRYAARRRAEREGIAVSEDVLEMLARLTDEGRPTRP